MRKEKMTILSATDFGAAGDGVTMNTDAIEKAVAKLEKEGGGGTRLPRRNLPGWTYSANRQYDIASGAGSRPPSIGKNC